MRYAVVYTSQTGNTARLAQTIRQARGEDACVYFGGPDARALEADRIYVGFWTDKGTCDDDIAEFLQGLPGREVFLFGTAGFGGDRAYFDQILGRVKGQLNPAARLVGCYMCQGKMPQTVRTRYEGMSDSPQRTAMLENFDRALSHPDEGDLAALREAVLA